LEVARYHLDRFFIVLYYLFGQHTFTNLPIHFIEIVPQVLVSESLRRSQRIAGNIHCRLQPPVLVVLLPLLQLFEVVQYLVVMNMVVRRVYEIVARFVERLGWN